MSNLWDIFRTDPPPKKAKETAPVTEEQIAPQAEPVTEEINWQARAEELQDKVTALEAELAAIPLAVRTPPEGYAWNGEPRVLHNMDYFAVMGANEWAVHNWTNNYQSAVPYIPLSELPAPTVTRTLTLPADASDEDILAAFRADVE